jgi:hypothetical protein
MDGLTANYAIFHINQNVTSGDIGKFVFGEKEKGGGVDLVNGMEFSKLISNIEKVDTVDCHIMHIFVMAGGQYFFIPRVFILLCIFTTKLPKGEININ